MKKKEVNSNGCLLMYSMWSGKVPTEEVGEVVSSCIGGGGGEGSIEMGQERVPPAVFGKGCQQKRDRKGCLQLVVGKVANGKGTGKGVSLQLFFGGGCQQKRDRRGCLQLFLGKVANRK